MDDACILTLLPEPYIHLVRRYKRNSSDRTVYHLLTKEDPESQTAKPPIPSDGLLRRQLQRCLRGSEWVERGGA